MAEIVGSARFFWITAPTPKLLAFANNNWIDNTNVYSVVPNKVVHFMPLANEFWGLAVLTADKFAADISWGVR
jgi:hypothetical protein